MATIRTFKDVKSKLEDIQKHHNEVDLFPTLAQLFVHMGFSNVQITHGTNEFGRDLIFSASVSPLGEEEWYAVVVKNKNAGQWDFQKDGEIGRQIIASIEYPWLLENGNKKYANKVLVVVNGSISNNAKSMIEYSFEPHHRNNIIVWNYQSLEQNIETTIKDLFLSGESGTQAEYEVNVYKKNMIEALSNLGNAKQLFLGTDDIEEIDDIFVNVRTAERKYEEERKQYGAETPAYLAGEMDDAIAIINSNRHTIITGIPTAGKTMLLKRIGLKALRDYESIGVFWFSMREIDSSNFDIDQEINKQFGSYTSGAIYKGENFQKKILLFDALDEVISDDTKRNILSIINAYIKIDATTKVIISGRELDIFDDMSLFGDYEKVNLLPFDVGQALKLVNKIIPRNKEKNNKFISAIKKQQFSSDLTRTPMALTLMAIMYNDDSIDLEELPANVTELFSKFSDYYLDKWDASKGLSSQYKYEQVKNIMGFIAYWMHSQYITEISTHDLQDLLQNIRETHPFDELNDIASYIQKLKERNTLLCYDSHKDVFYFAGVAFQEYFTSIYYDDSNETELLQYAYNDWWQNVMVFYNGRSPRRTVFVKKLIDHPIPQDGKSLYNHMHLLSKCMQAAHLIPNEVAKEGIRNIIKTFEYFYKTIFTPLEHGESLAYSWNTLDVILQFRKIFQSLFMSHHITDENFRQVAFEVLDAGLEQYSDVTLYCVSYHLFLRGEVDAFEKFLGLSYNTRWDRIITRDLQMKKLQKELPANVYNRIKRKQHSNKTYIDKQFKEPAILHLINGTTLKEINEE